MPVTTRSTFGLAALLVALTSVAGCDKDASGTTPPADNKSGKSPGAAAPGAPIGARAVQELCRDGGVGERPPGPTALLLHGCRGQRQAHRLDVSQLADDQDVRRFS